ncbi:liprin-beta-2b isoform X5 [Alosa sapidissima]|uniref:liprin-beta-2b isoform X5 n=1 Tax=Alosa sapidissima TaxID=34773 RepID=UPI001C09BD2D|nr:liprin-beta-2b isoform X5 [Alosa sapidissima]
MQLNCIVMASDASHMLEAALEQMDDIIAGSKAVAELSNGLYDLGSPVSSAPLQVLQLAEDLRLALELQACDGERETLRSQLPCATAHLLIDWLQKGSINLQSPPNNETCQERLARLEGDKQSLVLQVSVLTDQVEAQGEKIRDLECSLEEHHHKLVSTEEMLQQELLSRTSLETQKLDLMDEVSYLKLKLVGMEEEPQSPANGDDRQHKAESVVNLISELQEQMCKFQEEISTRIQEKRALEGQGNAGAREPHSQSPSLGLLGSPDPDDCCHCRGENAGRCAALVQELRLLKFKVDELEGEKSQYERKLKATKTEISELKQLLASKDSEIECLQSQLMARGMLGNDVTEREDVYRRKLKDKYQELQRLKIGMESLLAANDEKDRHIDELTTLLGQYRKMKDVMALSQVSNDKLLCGSSEEELSGSLKMRALTHKAHSDIMRSEMSSRGSSPLLVSPMCLQKDMDSSCRSFQMAMESTISPSSISYHNGQWQVDRPRLLSSSLEELQSGSVHKHVVGQPIEPVLQNQHADNNKYRTLPGKLSRRNAEQNGEREKYSSPLQLSPDESEDSQFNLSSRGRLDLFGAGKTERADDSTLSDLSPLSSGRDSGQQSPVSPEHRKTQRGIKKLWGKIRRSQSGSLPAGEPESAEFRRGGMRATAGPRLANAGQAARDTNTPFSKWSPEQVCSWLEDSGLGQYAIQTRQWISSGQTLLSASTQDIEKEMGIKHPLHRKKLQLALRSFSSKLTEKSAELDHIWVTRWLDDIGLPQYKDQFNDARVDGQMLQYLTVNDLLFLKVTSQLHHLSIKCAIHVLHVNKFNSNCLKRRPGDEHNISPSEVVQWSNHRVMEWLRSVDLAEYAPNLRGSGVHGGLIILEPRFNSDTLAMLLNIPPQKTLLRRHLATNFGSLVGGRAQQEKREFMESPSYTPLTTTAKVRPRKLPFSNFSHLRRRKADEAADYICPLEAAQVPAPALVNGAHRPYSGFRGLSPILDRDPERRGEQALVTQGTIMQIEALSEGINNLTDSQEQIGAIGACPTVSTQGRFILECLLVHSLA